MPANFAYRDGALHCEGVGVASLAAEHGTPLYVYSRRSMEDRVARLDAAFAPLDRLLAYSVKANGNLSVLRLLAGEGSGADIVSGGELYRALRAGVPAERIVFSGVGKTAPELDAALDASILCFNVESEGELRLLAERARARGRTAPVSLRINPDIESPTPHAYTRTGHRATKFGIASEDEGRVPGLKAARAVHRLQPHPDVWELRERRIARRQVVLQAVEVTTGARRQLTQLWRRSKRIRAVGSAGVHRPAVTVMQDLARHCCPVAATLGSQVEHHSIGQRYTCEVALPAKECCQVPRRLEHVLHCRAGSSRWCPGAATRSRRRCAG